MKKIIHLQHKFLSWEKDVIILATQSGILATLFGLIHVFSNSGSAVAIFAMIGVFVAALIQTIGIRGNIRHRVKANIILAISAGIATTIGCYYGTSFLAMSIGILLLVPLAGLTSSAEHLSAALTLFTVDLFIVSSGIPASLDLAIIYGCSFAVGALLLAVITLIYAKPFRQFQPATSHYRFSIRSLFINYRSNFNFAIILTVAVLAANAISFLFAMPQGFWIPMTALLILKSDHDFTKTRINHRLYGTLFGSLLAVIVAFSISSKIILALLMFPLMFFIIVAMARHYGAYTVVLTVMVTVMVNLMESAGYLIAEHRLLDTLLGVITVAISLWVFQPFLKRVIYHQEKRK